MKCGNLGGENRVHSIVLLPITTQSDLEAIFYRTGTEIFYVHTTVTLSQNLCVCTVVVRVKTVASHRIRILYERAANKMKSASSLCT